MKFYNNFLIITCLAGLTFAGAGCSPIAKVVNPYDEDFNCKAPSDTGKCMDTPTAYLEARYPSTVQDDPDKYLDDGMRGNLAGNKKAELQATFPRPLQLKTESDPLPSKEDKRLKNISGLLDQPQAPILAPPKILRVLLLPYTGEGEELFMTRFVYVQVEKPQWILSKIREN